MSMKRLKISTSLKMKEKIKKIHKEDVDSKMSFENE